MSKELDYMRMSSASGDVSDRLDSLLISSLVTDPKGRSNFLAKCREGYWLYGSRAIPNCRRTNIYHQYDTIKDRKLDGLLQSLPCRSDDHAARPRLADPPYSYNRPLLCSDSL